MDKKHEIPDELMIVLAVMLLAPAIFRFFDFILSIILFVVASIGKFFEWILPYLIWGAKIALLIGISFLLASVYKWLKQRIEAVWEKRLLESENSWNEKLQLSEKKMKSLHEEIEQLKHELKKTRYLLEKKAYEEKRTPTEAVNDSLKSIL